MIMAKSNAQRCREWRQRQRVKQNKIKKKSKAKSNAERARECRLRKKAREAMSRIVNDLLPVGGRENVANQHDIEMMNIIHGNVSNNPEILNMHKSIYNPNTPYSRYHRDSVAHREFEKKFTNNPFGHACSVCDRLWFKDELRAPSPAYKGILNKILPHTDNEDIRLCHTCTQALKKNTIPAISTYNGFKYPEMPDDLPPLDLISERLISPRIPFMQIRRLRHVNGQDGIYGQVINVPVSVDTMVHQLPRNIDDDHCINAHIKYKKINRSSYVSNLIDNGKIKAWLHYLINSPLYRLHGITINEPFFEAKDIIDEIPVDNLSEHIPIEDSLVAQQQTLLWNAERYLRITPGENNVLKGSLFDEHAEELSFPAIYLGQLCTFREDVRITPFMMATSELRRSDRRGVTPYHLLYLAMKIMRLRIRENFSIASKSADENTNITREQVVSEDYINSCIESNLAFLRAIPNSTSYWAEQKRDLFAMIRQLGKPTMFLNLSANEIGWNNLLQTLYRLKNKGSEISEQAIDQLNYLQKSTLVTEDAVTCAIYFSKLVNILMDILQSKKWSPFGRYRVVHYFKRMEFPHWGSPHVHILLWLENAPKDALKADREDAVALIDRLIAVSAAEASGNIELQTHQHKSTCYERVVSDKPRKCKFEAPFMPSRKTVILIPMQKRDLRFATYAKRYASLRSNLESNDYSDIDTFYAQNNVTSDEEYTNILRAGITTPRVFLKRQPSEKWHNPFNPFIFNVLRSNTDIQFITDEYSCASYVTEYINKTDRGMSDLQRKILETMDEHPEFKIGEVTRKMRGDMINFVELTSQEAAWYLLREPLSKSSVPIAYIPTVRPLERQRKKKNHGQLNRMQCDEDSGDIWKDNWLEKYEKRPMDMRDITLAQFVANYTSNAQGTLIKRKKSRVIRYRNYDIATDFDEHRREMVTLHIPFRSEEKDILADMKYIKIYDDNEEFILQNHSEFSSNFDIRETIKICRELCGETKPDDDEIERRNAAKWYPEPNSFQQNSSSVNSRSLLIHKENLNNVVMQQVNILILWKTGLKDEYNTGIPKFDCVIRFKRSDVQTTGVAVYGNNVNNTNMFTPHLNINFQISNAFSVNTSAVGDVCAAECNIYSHQKVLIVVIYISPNHSIKDIIQFIHRSLAIYTAEVAAHIDPELGRIPMIFSGHFNVDFALAESQSLIDFLYDKLQLRLTNNYAEAMIGSETTVDVVFSRFLDRIHAKVFVSYFNYHQPVTSFVQDDDIDDE